MKRYSTLLLLTLCGVLSAQVGSTGGPVGPKAVATPRVHLSWDAPWGDPKAKKDLVTTCSDTTQSHRLYLSFEAPASVLPLAGMSGALLFEPEAGDTLGPFWDFERGGSNNGGLIVDFDRANTSEECDYPWKRTVFGKVGYAHATPRGRLDLSADVPPEQVYNLFPKLCYVWARVTITEKGAGLDGCMRPMRITWVGGSFRSTRPGSGDLHFAMGPDQSVTWNARRGGLALRRTRLAIETWIPNAAPLSRAALAERRAAIGTSSE